MTDATTALAELRRRRPLVHCITNYVSMDIMANVLLAIGAAPAMAHAEEEAAEFAGIASAVSINIGTLSAPWVRAMELAVGSAASRSTPWVLDPVGCGATKYRTDVAARLAMSAPSVIRGNASEVMALAHAVGAKVTAGKTRGVDSADTSAHALEAAHELGRITRACVTVTGAVDYVVHEGRETSVHGGDELLTSVTATGCSLSSVVAAFLGAGSSSVDASAAACALFAETSERAKKRAGLPGSFREAFIDGLAEIRTLDAARVRSR